MFSAMFAGLGGALFAHFQRYINPESFVFSVSILFITMVVVGGMGNIWGGLVGVDRPYLPSFGDPGAAAVDTRDSRKA